MLYFFADRIKASASFLAALDIGTRALCTDRITTECFVALAFVTRLTASHSFRLVRLSLRSRTR